jgi:DNA-binding LytR/AlgR family response regulator
VTTGTTAAVGTVGARRGLSVLAVDDEKPALDELTYLLGADERIGSILTAGSGPEALRVLSRDEHVDAVFLDVRMPGATGLDIARALARRPDSPQVVFVTAHEDFAVGAFDLHACDYLLKPVRQDRLAEAVRRVHERVHARGGQPQSEDEVIPVELAGVTRFLMRSQIRFVEAHGDYARLHTATGSNLVRISLAALEERWTPHGFARIHRSYLVALRHVDEVRWDAGHTTVKVGGKSLAVSRRHARELRDRLVGDASRREQHEAEPGH